MQGCPVVSLPVLSAVLGAMGVLRSPSAVPQCGTKSPLPISSRNQLCRGLRLLHSAPDTLPESGTRRGVFSVWADGEIWVGHGSELHDAVRSYPGGSVFSAQHPVLCASLERGRALGLICNRQHECLDGRPRLCLRMKAMGPTHLQGRKTRSIGEHPPERRKSPTADILPDPADWVHRFVT